MIVFFLIAAGWTADSRFYIEKGAYASGEGEGDDSASVHVRDVRSGKEVLTEDYTDTPVFVKWLKRHPEAAGTKPVDVTIASKTESTGGAGVWRDGTWSSSSTRSVTYLLKRGGKEYTILSREGPCETLTLEWSPDGRRVAFVTVAVAANMRSDAKYIYDFASVAGPRIEIIFAQGDDKRAVQIADTIETKIKPQVISGLLKSKAPKWTGRIVHGPGLEDVAEQIAAVTRLPVVRRDGVTDIVIDLTQPKL